MSTLELQKRDEMPLAPLRDDPLAQVSAMLQAAIKNGVTPENVSVAKELMGLFKDMQAQKAEQDFDDALAQLQAECQQVQATKAVGNLYKYAPYEDIMKQVQPLLTKYGFSVSFDSESTEKANTMICILSRKGHKKVNRFCCRVGGGQNWTPAQADAAAASSAQRNALCDSLNITIRHVPDADPRDLGKPISKEQASDLRKRVQSCGASEPDFLKFAQAKTYEEIMSGRYAELDKELRRKEKTT